MDYKYEIGKLEGMLESTNAKFFVLHSLIREFLISFDDSIKLQDFFESVLYEDERAIVITKIIKAFNYGLSTKQVTCEMLEKVYEKITGYQTKFNFSFINTMLKEEDKIKSIYELYKFFAKNDDKLIISEQFARLVVILLLSKFRIISYPIIDFSFANRKFGEIKSLEDFTEVLKLASKSSFNLLSKARQIIVTDTNKLKEINVKSSYAVYDYACSNLVIDIGGTASSLDYTFVTVNKTLRHLLNAYILTKKSGNMRYRTFIYKRLIDVFEI